METTRATFALSGATAAKDRGCRATLGLALAIIFYKIIISRYMEFAP